MEKEFVNLTVKGGIGSIEFFNPIQNSLPRALLNELTKLLNQASHDEHVKVIVLKSGGDRVFCSGASFQELVRISNKDEGFEFFLGFANVLNAMRQCSKIIIVRVQGKVVGGGLGIAAAADYCMATKYAEIRLSELNIGIGPFVISPALKRKIGVGPFSQLALSADKFYSPYWAKDKGLFQDVFENKDQLDAAVQNLTNKLCSYNNDALKNLKKVFWENTDNWRLIMNDCAKLSGSMILSSHAKKALQKYINP